MVILDFAEELEQSTDGAIQIEVFEATLGAPTDAWDMLENNNVQLTFTAEAYNPGRMPIVSLLNMPFELPNFPVVSSVMGAWLQAGYLTELTDHFHVVLYQPVFPQGLWLTDQKPTTLADLEQMKISVASGLMGETFAALGATAVSIGPSDVYMSLQTGAIDGVTSGIDNMISRKWFEQTQYGLQEGFFAGCFILLMNLDTWNSLPSDLQDTITQIANDVSAYHLERRAAEQEDFQQTLTQSGVELYNISADELAKWKQATASVTEDYVADLDSQGFPASNAIDLLRETVSDYEATH
jgi:TRAP-type C4-dicarboxylate transport system substrate-binding protein